MPRIRCERCDASGKYSIGFVERTCDVCYGDKYIDAEHAEVAHTPDEIDEFMKVNPNEIVNARLSSESDEFKEGYNDQMAKLQEAKHVHTPISAATYNEFKKQRGRPRRS